MKSDEKARFHPIVKRITSAEDFDKILNNNLEEENLSKWKVKFPNHEQWIRNIIKKLKDNNYERLAFGVFVSGPHVTSRLVCSALVKRSHLAPHLEIKNVLCFNAGHGIPQDVFEENRSDYYKRIVKHVVRFAESRGFTRVSTEVINRNNEDEQLITALLTAGFVYGGNRTGLYRAADEVLTLVYDVNPIYGLDPYDFDSAAKWVVQRYLPNAVQQQRFAVKVFGAESGKEHELSCVQMKIGHGHHPVLEKFSSTFCYIVVPSYFSRINAISSIDRAHAEGQISTPLYVFDFTVPEQQQKHKNGNHVPAAPSIWDEPLRQFLQVSPSGYTFFNRRELDTLLYAGNAMRDRGAILDVGERRVSAALPFSEVSGLLTLTDSERLDGKRINENFSNGKFSVYVKLGAKGRFLNEGHVLVFYYPNSDNPDDHSVWGFAEVRSALHVDAARERAINSEYAEETTSAQIYTDLASDFLDDAPVDFLWDMPSITKHNQYNASDQVVVVFLKRYFNVDPPLPLSEIIHFDTRIASGKDIDYERRKAIVKEVDAYLSEKEVSIIKYASQSFRDAVVADKTYLSIPAKPHALLHLYQEPHDHDILTDESNDLESAIKDQVAYTCLSPCSNKSFAGIRERILEDKPNIVHVTAHGSENPAGLKVCENGVSEPSKTMTGDDLAEILDEAGSVFLLVLNLCYSDAFAGKVSRGRYVLAHEGKPSEDQCLALTKELGAVLRAGYHAETIERHLRGLVTEHQKSFQGLTLWINGSKSTQDIS